jgi:DNA topoisomerase-1
MAKNLFIVESPAKAKTIEKYLGSDFVVKSSIGHIRDLVKKGMGVDVENNFEPEYVIQEDKKQVVKELKKLAKEAEIVWLATDEDREGEAISWHLLEALGIDEKKAKRVVYNEITKDAILKAINNPRTIDRNLVDAQQARRVLDRLVGFELSPLLWRKVKPSLSAGRVQSVAVRIIVEREREIQAFNPESSFKIIGNFDVNGRAVVKSELPKNIVSFDEAKDFLTSCRDAKFKVQDLKKRPGKKSPAPPFTTSTLQQEAARKLGFSVSQTMSVAQRLYEQGIITYMRTDSVNLSELAVNGIGEMIQSEFGKEYHKPKRFSTKTEGAQEAHEAIRPTNFSLNEFDGDYAQSRLYDLIWKRTVASQMAEAQFERTTVDIEISNRAETLQAKGEILTFDGFLKLYIESTDDEDDEEKSGLLPDLEVGQPLILTDMNARERFTKHPPRYTEASLVKKLEENGIGRPSTYAPTISTILKRTYVVKEDREGQERHIRVVALEGGEVNDFETTEVYGAERGKIFPTDIGILVNDFLEENFQNIMKYEFTANVEQQFDEIAEGRRDWKKMLENFYQPFHDNVEHTLEHSDRVTGERLLGEDPKTGKNVYVRMGKYGPLAQLGEQPEDDEDEKPKFASLRNGQSIQDISLEEALELFKLPRVIGEYDEKPLKVNIGRFGPYVQSGSLFASIPKDEDPMSVEFDRGVELIELKKKADAEKYINEFEHESGAIQILKGRYGPYIKQGRNNFKIPKDVEPQSIDLNQALEIMKDQAQSKGKKRGGRKTKKTSK